MLYIAHHCCIQTVLGITTMTCLSLVGYKQFHYQITLRRISMDANIYVIQTDHQRPQGLA